MTVARVKIDIQAGLIELEGEHDFVGSYLDKLLPLVESAGLTSGGKNAAKASTDELSSAREQDDDGVDTGKKKRKVPKRPPSGASCRDRILGVKADGYFAEHRTPTDIVGALGKKGWTHTSNQVSAALGTMFNAGEIQRTKSADGRGFTYFWDRS